MTRILSRVRKIESKIMELEGQSFIEENRNALEVQIKIDYYCQKGEGCAILLDESNFCGRSK